MPPSLLAPEVVLEAARLGDRVERGVRDELVDLAAHQQALLAVDVGPLHAPLGHRGVDVAGERVLGLVVVVVGVEGSEARDRTWPDRTPPGPFLTVASGTVPGMIVDAWVNLFPEAFAAKWVAQEENAGRGAAVRRGPGQGPHGRGPAGGDGRRRHHHRRAHGRAERPRAGPPPRRLRGGGLHRHRRAAPGTVPRVGHGRSGCQAARQLPPRAGAGPAPRRRARAGHAARGAVRAQPPPLLPGVRGVRRGGAAGVDQRRRAGAAGALALPGPGAARGRAHRLPRPHR